MIGLLVSNIDTRQTLGVWLSFFIAVFSGVIEATLVGLAQWWAMHPWLSKIRRRVWWQATTIGALCAYMIGYLPSTLMKMDQAVSQTQQVEPPLGITLLLASGLGGVAGVILSCAQWMVLRHHVGRAKLWILANMLAWAVGMPVIFLGMDWAFTMADTWSFLLTIGAALIAAGLLVGAIQAWFLIVLVSQNLDKSEL